MNFGEAPNLNKNSSLTKEEKIKKGLDALGKIKKAKGKKLPAFMKEVRNNVPYVGDEKIELSKEEKIKKGSDILKAIKRDKGKNPSSLVVEELKDDNSFQESSEEENSNKEDDLSSLKGEVDLESEVKEENHTDNEKQENNSQEESEEKKRILKREIDRESKSTDKDYTVYEKRKSDLADLENQEKEYVDNTQGDAMEALIERESDADIKTPEEKQGEDMEFFIKKESGDEGDDEKNNANSNIEKAENEDDLESELNELSDSGELNRAMKMKEDGTEVWIKKSNGEWRNGKITSFGARGLYVQVEIPEEKEKMLKRNIKTKEFLKWQDEQHPLRTGSERDAYIKTQESDVEKVKREEKENPEEKAPEGEILEMHDLENKKSEEGEVVELEDLEDPKMKRLARGYEEAKQKYMEKEKEFDSVMTKVRNVLGSKISFLKKDFGDLEEYKKQYEKAQDAMMDYKNEQMKNFSDSGKKEEAKRFARYQDQDTVLKGDRERKIKKVKEKKKTEDKKDNPKNEEKNKAETKKNNPKGEEEGLKKENNSKKDKQEKKISKEENIKSLMEKYDLSEEDEPIVRGGKLIKKMSLGLSKNWRSFRNLKFSDLEGRIDPKLKKNIDNVIEDLSTIWGDEIRPDKNKNETVQAWLARAINNSWEENKENKA
jgi:hypothetical protein